MLTPDWKPPFPDRTMHPTAMASFQFDPMRMIEGSADEILGPLNEVESRNAPARLFALGRLELVQHWPRVAIVGSRKASEDGRKRAVRLARFLAQHEIAVVSGLAEGIDTAAHEAAMDAGGATIAVLGTPFDQVYPRSNAALQRRIAEGHLLLSQFAPSTPVQRKNFVLRNRTMALASNASVIVEAGEGSGTLSQGWEALRLRRPLFLMRSIIERETLHWPQQMLDHGAEILGDPEQVLEAIPAGPIAWEGDVPF
jgi:DNA processing protein